MVALISQTNMQGHHRYTYGRDLCSDPQGWRIGHGNADHSLGSTGPLCAVLDVG
jgi:hypothetical protein